jgi:hypothetical protein
MRLVLLLVLLFSSPVWAQSESFSLRQRVLLVWGGGRTREEAESFLTAYQERAGDWARVLELAPGYPRIIDGAELPGLRGEVWFVALGVCEGKEGAEVAKVFKALEPLSSSRRVMWDERESLACPSLLEGWSFGKGVRARVSGGTLTATTFLHEEENPRGRGWLLVLALLKKGDAESTVIEPPEEGALSEVKALRVGRGEVVLEELLTDPTCDTEPRAEVHARTWRFSAEKGQLVTKQAKKLLHRKDCTPEQE